MAEKVCAGARKASGSSYRRSTSKGLMFFDGHIRLAVLIHLGIAEGFDLPCGSRVLNVRC